MLVAKGENLFTKVCLVGVDRFVPFDMCCMFLRRTEDQPESDDIEGSLEDRKFEWRMMKRRGLIVSTYWLGKKREG